MVLTQAAATTLIVREPTGGGIEVLLLKRNSKLAFAPNCWVFPGGRVDAEDGSHAAQHLEATAKIAAAREAHEEAGIAIDPRSMVHFCHWTTPLGGSRRFSTWFFHCQHSELNHNIQIDNSEIVDHIWISPAEALQLMKARKLFLLPPTFINLERIKDAKNYKEVAQEFYRTGVVTAAPVTYNEDKIFYSMYRGDSGYEATDIKLTTSLHRLVMNMETMEYQFLYENCNEPPVNGSMHIQDRG